MSQAKIENRGEEDDILEVLEYWRGMVVELTYYRTLWEEVPYGEMSPMRFVNKTIVGCKWKSLTESKKIV